MRPTAPRNAFARPLRLVVLAAAVTAVHCSEIGGPANDERAEPPLAGAPLAGLNVSEPTAAAAASGSAADAPVTYVSLPPGTLPGATSIEMRNAATVGPVVRITVIEGGFDPVAITASPGDRLDVTVHEANGVTRKFSATVPPRRPPSIVRVDPPKGRTDVALGVRPAVIFSEPIDPATVSPISFQLRLGATAVPATVALLPASPWVAEVTPAAPLEPGNTYTLVIGTEVRDLAGDSLDRPESVSFTTTDTQPAATGKIAFSSTRDGAAFIYVANADGAGVTRLAPGNFPSLSHDREKIAFARWDWVGDEWYIYVMNTDGSDVTLLGPGTYPVWSPDGSRILFREFDRNAATWEGGAAMAVMNADGSDLRYFTDPGEDGVCSTAKVVSAEWSPEGRRIVYATDAPPYFYGDTCIMNADGTGVRPLVGTPPSWYVNPGAFWSPDGSRITVTVDAAPFNYPRLASFPIDTSVEPPIHLAPPPERWRAAFARAWSPDGSRLVFSSRVPSSACCRIAYRLFVLTVATGAVRQLIPDARIRL